MENNNETKKKIRKQDLSLKEKVRERNVCLRSALCVFT